MSNFQSTVSRPIPRRVPDRFNLLANPYTGAPVGIQNPSGNGNDGMWVPVDLTAGQILTPTAEMLADLDVVYRLNVAPYTRYFSDGTILRPFGTDALNVYNSSTAPGIAGDGTPATPFTDPTGTAGVQYFINHMETAATGGVVMLPSAQMRTTASITIAASNESIIAPSLAFGPDTGPVNPPHQPGLRGNFASQTGSVIIPQSELTNGVIHFQGNSVRTAGGELRNIYMFGPSATGGGIGIRVDDPLVATRWTNLTISGFTKWCDIRENAENLIIEDTIGAACAFGPFFEPSVNISELFTKANNWSDMEFEGFANFSGSHSELGHTHIGDVFIRNAVQLIGFHGAISATTLTVADMTIGTFNGTSSGGTLAITGITTASGALPQRFAISGTGIPAACQVLGQFTGTGGSDGNYTTSLATTCTGVETLTATSLGYLAAGRVVKGAGVTGNVIITAQLTGTPGGVGTYTVTNPNSVTVTNEEMYATGANIYDSTPGGTWSGVTSTLAGTNWPYVQNVQADGAIFAAASAGGTVTGCNFSGNANGYGIRVTGSGYTISGNQFGSNGGGGATGDVLFDVGSSGNTFIQLTPCNFTDNGTGNTAFWVDLAGVYHTSGVTLQSNTGYIANTASAGATLAASSMVGAQAMNVINMTGSLSGGATLTMPTVAALVAARPGKSGSDTTTMRIINNSAGAFAWTLTAGASESVAGTATIAQAKWRDYRLIFISGTSVVAQDIGSGVV